MPDGTIVATICNQPCHGLWEGDVECWGSEDGGRTWRLRGTPAPHEPGTNRMNVAAGLAANGDPVVIASGWTHRPPKGKPAGHEPPAHTLPAWVCRSSDGGRTWSRDAGLPAAPEPGMGPVAVPFGDVLQSADGALCVSAYAGRREAGGVRSSAYLYRSYDDGRTWGQGTVIGKDDCNETAPLHLGEGHWLAASRTERLGELHLFVSEDDARTWRFSQPLSLPGQHPAHLMRLPDGRILLTYGNRCVGHTGVDVRVSADEGQTWGDPKRLVNLDFVDLGYPATVATNDGKLCSAWYTSGLAAAHQRYHMGTLIWDVNEVAPRK